jgi:hypothetical protein
MKKSGAFRSSLLTAASVLAGISTVHGQVLFSDDFNTTNGSDWKVNALTGFDRAQFLFDYSTVGVPAAPNSGGTTLGVRLQANRTGGTTLSGVSISPIGQSFTGDYQLRFDLWQNYQAGSASIAVGGNGTTQLTGAGILTSGNVATFAGAGDGLWFADTMDGGSATDYRVYYKTTAQTTASLYNGGSQQNSNAYYSNFGGVQAPAAQTALYPEQGNLNAGATALSPVGTLSFGWHDVQITKIGNTVTWDVDGKRIATVPDITAISGLGGNNILLEQTDSNASSSTDVNSDNLLFGLIDNVRVTTVPEPSTYALLGSGALLLLARARRGKR